MTEPKAWWSWQSSSIPPVPACSSLLRDESLFRQVRTVLGAVTWPGDLDLAPDAMHRAIKEHGAWIVK
jgi:Protein of unknown function (DUF2442)